MTVSRSGKRGNRAGTMSYRSRDGRVRSNAIHKSTTKRLVASGGPRYWSYIVGGENDWAQDIRPANQNDSVAPLALQHGRYEVADTILRPSVLETEIAPRIVNRSVTVVDDWIDSGVFIRPQIRVIEYARELWRDIRRPCHPFFDRYDAEDRDDSFDSERAKNLLRRCRALVGRGRWYVFENVVRWNEPTGIPGSRVAHVSEASLGAAQQIVREVADQIRSIL